MARLTSKSHLDEMLLPPFTFNDIMSVMLQIPKEYLSSSRVTVQETRDILALVDVFLLLCESWARRRNLHRKDKKLLKSLIDELERYRLEVEGVLMREQREELTFFVVPFWMPMTLNPQIAAKLEMVGYLNALATDVPPADSSSESLVTIEQETSTIEQESPRELYERTEDQIRVPYVFPRTTDPNKAEQLAAMGYINACI